MSRTTPLTARLASVALLALLAAAVPLASGQSGPPPGYTDPLVYAQDYAANQTGTAQADPVGYASGKASAEAVGNESEHAAWLACWAAYEYGQGAHMAADPVCSQFFTAPQQVDAPAEATGEITEVLDETGAEDLLGETVGAAEGLVEDPTSAPEQVQRILDAIGRFLGTAADFVVGLVMGIVDLLGLGGSLAVEGIGGMLDGLLMLVGLPALGLQTALGGIGLGLGALGSGALATLGAVGAGLEALGTGVVSVVDGIGDGLGAIGDGLALAASGIGDGIGAAVGAVGDAAGAVGAAIGDAADAIGDAVASLFGGDGGGASEGVEESLDGVETGTEADGLLDRVLDLV